MWKERREGWGESKHQSYSLLLLFFPQLIPLISLPLSSYKIENKPSRSHKLLNSEYEYML